MNDTVEWPRSAVYTAWVNGSSAIPALPRPAGARGGVWPHPLTSRPLQARMSTTETLPGSSLNAWLAT